MTRRNRCGSTGKRKSCENFIRSGSILGDLNGMGGTNGADIQPFVNGIMGAPSQDEICAGDFNGNSGLDVGDINGMVNALLGP